MCLIVAKPSIPTKDTDAINIYQPIWSCRQKPGQARALKHYVEDLWGHHNGVLLSKDRLASCIKEMIAQAYMNAGQEMPSSIKYKLNLTL